MARTCASTLSGIELYLLRHGMTRWNAERRYLGHTDAPLDPARRNGLEPAKRLLQSVPFGAVYCSDLRRCRETLAYVRPDLPARYDARLRELDFGDWEGAVYEQLAGLPAYRDWLERWEETAPPNGERGADMRKRIHSFAAEMEAGFGEAGAPGRPVLIVAHGGSIRMLAARYIPGLSPWEPQISHGGLVRLKLCREAGQSWRCRLPDGLEVLAADGA